MNIKDWMTNNLKKDSIILEAGMCDGKDTRFFADFFTEGKVYGFEPIPSLFSQASQILGDKTNVEISNMALSDKTGKGKIFLSDRFGQVAGSSSLLNPKDHLDVHPQITFKEEVDVDTINLDEWFESKGLDKIDFMWLDMQGYEPIVLKNALNTLSKTKYLYTEVSLIETYDSVMLYPEYKKFLEENGFEVIDEELPWEDMGNVLFKNKKN
jgi:FkbM family methyltransferase